MTTEIWMRTIIVICLLGAIAGAGYTGKFMAYKRTRAAIIATIITIAFVVGFFVTRYLYNEPREASNCIITAYTSNGLITAEYSGKLTVKDEEKGYVVFEDENGKEHTVVTVDGAIIIEQQFESGQLSGQDYSVITVKTNNGLVIEQYSGYHDIKENKVGYISFEDINGKALTISYGGTVTIDVE